MTLQDPARNDGANSVGKTRQIGALAWSGNDSRTRGSHRF
jgi:hypothetical protein